MPHVSGRKLKKHVFLKMSEEFIEIFAAVRTKQKARRLLEELLTQTERIMIAKRLAMIFMVEKGYSFETIERILKISPVTTSKYWRMTKRNEFPLVSRYFKSKKQAEEFWRVLERAVRMGMPPMGKGRWNFLKNMPVKEDRSRGAKK